MARQHHDIGYQKKLRRKRLQEKQAQPRKPREKDDR